MEVTRNRTAAFGLNFPITKPRRLRRSPPGTDSRWNVWLGKLADEAACPSRNPLKTRLPELWSCYDLLPIAIQHQADKHFTLFQANPGHPSLHFKETGPYWSARVSRGHRALARRRGN